VLKNFKKTRADYAAAKTNRFRAMDVDYPTIDYLPLATSMGVPTHHIERSADATAAIEAGITNLIEVVISTS
jgi:benzoylformate decarboxylase